MYLSLSLLFLCLSFFEVKVRTTEVERSRGVGVGSGWLGGRVGRVRVRFSVPCGGRVRVARGKPGANGMYVCLFSAHTAVALITAVTAVHIYMSMMCITGQEKYTFDDTYAPRTTTKSREV